MKMKTKQKSVETVLEDKLIRKSIISRLDDTINAYIITSTNKLMLKIHKSDIDNSIVEDCINSKESLYENRISFISENEAIISDVSVSINIKDKYADLISSKIIEIKIDDCNKEIKTIFHPNARRLDFNKNDIIVILQSNDISLPSIRLYNNIAEKVMKLPISMIINIEDESAKYNNFFHEEFSVNTKHVNVNIQEFKNCVTTKERIKPYLDFIKSEIMTTDKNDNVCTHVYKLFCNNELKHKNNVPYFNNIDISPLLKINYEKLTVVDGTIYSIDGCSLRQITMKDEVDFRKLEKYIMFCSIFQDIHNLALYKCEGNSFFDYIVSSLTKYSITKIKIQNDIILYTTTDESTVFYGIRYIDPSVCMFFVSGYISPNSKCISINNNEVIIEDHNGNYSCKVRNIQEADSDGSLFESKSGISYIRDPGNFGLPIINLKED